MKADDVMGDLQQAILSRLLSQMRSSQMGLRKRTTNNLL